VGRIPYQEPLIAEVVHGVSFAPYVASLLGVPGLLRVCRDPLPVVQGHECHGGAAEVALGVEHLGGARAILGEVVALSPQAVARVDAHQGGHRTHLRRARHRARHRRARAVVAENLVHRRADVVPRLDRVHKLCGGGQVRVGKC